MGFINQLITGGPHIVYTPQWDDLKGLPPFRTIFTWMVYGIGFTTLLAQKIRLASITMIPPFLLVESCKNPYFRSFSSLIYLFNGVMFIIMFVNQRVSP